LFILISRFHPQKDAEIRRKLLYFKDVDRETIQKLIDAMEAHGFLLSFQARAKTPILED
jgi:hypothetical protein